MARSFEVFHNPTDQDLNGAEGADEVQARKEFEERWKGTVDWYEYGWYYWWCEPGCSPDSDPIGPFTTYEQAAHEATEEQLTGASP